MSTRSLVILTTAFLVTGPTSVQGAPITTVAGGGPGAQPALTANLDRPSSVAFDAAGNMYIAASGLQRVFKSILLAR